MFRFLLFLSFFKGGSQMKRKRLGFPLNLSQLPRERAGQEGPAAGEVVVPEVAGNAGCWQLRPSLLPLRLQIGKKKKKRLVTL